MKSTYQSSAKGAAAAQTSETRARLSKVSSQKTIISAIAVLSFGLSTPPILVKEHRFGQYRLMDQDVAIEAFGALAQTSRMAIFRLLVRMGPEGLQVGEIGRRLNIVPSTLSGHLAVLKHAGLLHATRHQREIHYAANLAAVNELVEFLLSECCEGRVENCSEILSLLSA